MRNVIETGLSTRLDQKLVCELLDAHSELKRNYYLGGLRLSAVEGGRFGEAAFRLLEEIAFGSYTPLNRQLDTEVLINKLRSLPMSVLPDAIRLHIPRSLRLIYDIRNNRDVAHLADGIDPNMQDAMLVVSCSDWVLAEFVRLYHNVTPDEAQRIVESIVERVAPVVQDFSGFLKILNPNLTAGYTCLVLLYQRSANGATFEEIKLWVKPAMQGNLKRTLNRLVDTEAHVHFDGERYKITRSGQHSVEKKRLVDLG